MQAKVAVVEVRRVRRVQVEQAAAGPHPEVRVAVRAHRQDHSSSGNSPGNWKHPVNIPHAIGWLAGAAAALAAKGGQQAVNSGKSLVGKSPEKKDEDVRRKRKMFRKRRTE